MSPLLDQRATVLAREGAEVRGAGSTQEGVTCHV